MSKNKILILALLYGFAVLTCTMSAGCQPKSETLKNGTTLSTEDNKPQNEFAEAAATYIGNFLKDQNLKGFFSGEDLYFQKFDVEKREVDECSLETNSAQVENWTDFLEISNDFYGERELDLLFLGYGRRLDYQDVDIKGHLVAFWSGAPDSQRSPGEIDREKAAMAVEYGAVGTLLIPQEEEKFIRYIQQIKPYFPPIRYLLFKNPEEALLCQRSISIGSSALARLFGMNPNEFDALKKKASDNNNPFPRLVAPIRMKTSYTSHGIIPTQNIVACLEGTDKKDEYIILSAHYDGRGIVDGKICNGANDNATGVAALMEIAEAFSLAARNGFRPRRSLIFFCPAAEELLGLGSTFYTDNPVVPLSKTVANVNMDPVGREDAERPALKNHVSVYTSQKGKTDLDDIRKQVEPEFTARLRIEEKSTYTGSDHVFFERKGIPVIAFTTGSSRDNHGPGDDPDKIQYQKLADITQLIFASVWELSNREERIKSPQ